jgi:hypothetical protein
MRLLQDGSDFTSYIVNREVPFSLILRKEHISKNNEATLYHHK